jgi:hypothetical protein
MKYSSATKRIAVLEIFSLFLLVLLPLLTANQAEAASHQQTWVRLDRMAASATTGGMVCVKTAVADVTESNVAVTFPTGFGVNATASNWTTTTTNLPVGATAWLGIGTATNVTGQVVTFPSSNLTANTLYCFNFASASTLTNHATPAANYTGTVASGGNSSSYATAIISNDQIVVTATVPATFSFALSANADSLGTLSTTTVSSTGVTATIGTNAASGWVAWVKSANAALNSAGTGASIPTAGSVDNSPTDLTSVTGYVLDVNITTDSATGTGTVSQAADYGAEYNGTNTTSGGTLSTTFQPIAASSGTTDGDVLTLIERAKISAVQAAATDYTDTLTIVAAGRF